MSLLTNTPELDLATAKDIVSQRFGIVAAQITELPSERDQNFKITARDGNAYVLKIANGHEHPDFLTAQQEMIRRLHASEIGVPKIMTSTNGQELISVAHNDQSYLARLVKYVDGWPLSKYRYRSKALIRDLGRTVGRFRNSLQGYDHPALHRDFHWDLSRANLVIKQNLDLVSDAELKDSILHFVDLFERHTRPVLNDLPKSVIHNDFNDGNIIVKNDAVAGIIDFGDAVFSWSIAELAIAIAYALLDQQEPLPLAAEMASACHHQSPLMAPEIEALFGLVCMRLCVSATLAAKQQRLRPEDPYLSISQTPICELLPKLKSIPYQIATTTFRQSCGLTNRFQQANSWIKEHVGEFALPVLIGNKREANVGERGPQPDKSIPSFCLLDCSVASTFLPPNLDSVPMSELTSRCFREMQNRGADIGVGRYLEPRIIYAAEHFGSEELDFQRRTIHLGVDLFAPADTPVVAPLDGTIECAVKIDLPLDYGNLVILKHEPAKDVAFYTLYGHLADRTLDRISIGQSIRKGETFGWLGEECENGGWVPHLHFQIIHHLLDYREDFPGVCVANQVNAWSEICPNPDLILGLPQDVHTEYELQMDQTLAERSQSIGPSLSVAYECPVKAVRGWQHWLYDYTGRRFLDAYNNVPHVGHCHPRVVKAIVEQASLLNTNTRYLNDSLNKLGQRLASTMPAGLEVCYFVNSASEANELALRLARAATGNTDLIVLESAYHGHSTTLIDISPYKHAGPGGQGAPDWVHVAPLPDIYRGSFRDPSTAGSNYARQVTELIHRLSESTTGLCGFIAESCPSVAGQFMLPEGYLSEVYQAVRSAGGICIADDVQTGYGRLGSVFYGFELQHVVPDVVVLGKPIGNGYPLAAVVTTREIANAFDDGMEFFSTFGGNNVACQAGLAVLDVIEKEQLQFKALETGEFLLSQFKELKSKHDLIGDVRGSGLFLGIELVRDHETLEPADTEASFIVNRMRDNGILIGTDGALHNVIKIRPPMTFGLDEARILAKTLDRCFELLPPDVRS